MAKPILSEELWATIEPLLPAEKEKPKGGRPRVSNRDVLRGIIRGGKWDFTGVEGAGSVAPMGTANLNALNQYIIADDSSPPQPDSSYYVAGLPEAIHIVAAL